MTNQSTISPAKRQRRYTVSRLLELAPQIRPAHFDLSKFTYDAARAGVVPPLGACAMANRRTSSDRPRGWSQESSSSQEEVIIYQGNRGMMKNPERQPTVPPTEPRAQKDDGFAKFLKKHSSPTHQRVTTGGRIVPMEQQPRPPFFSLPQPSQTMEDHKTLAYEGFDGMAKQHVVGHDQAKAGAEDNSSNIPHSQPLPYMPISAGLMDSSAFTGGAIPSVMAANNPFVFDTTRMQQTYPQAMSPVPFYAGMHGDQYGIMMTQSHMYPGAAMPFAGFNGALGPNLPSPFIPNPQMLGPPPSCGITTTPTETQPEANFYAEQALNQAVDHFKTLDEQLKTLDRHRAVSELDPYLANQRMAIVQLRAEAKNHISYWSEKAGHEHRGIVSNGVTNSKLNVQATSYVPRAHQSGETFAEDVGSSFKPNGVGHHSAKPDFVVDSTRRPIPIVPPPGKLPSPQQIRSGNAASKLESVEVDGWGVRVGPAPPEIQREQNEMLKELGRQASISPLDSGENAVMFTPQSNVISPPTQPYGTKALKANTDPNFDENDWVPTNPGRAPPTVEACYEVQLDAMRLPAGTMTKIRLPDGTITEVRGCGLKRPPSFELDEFEHRYWTAKPTLTQEMFNNFIELRHSDGDTEPPSIADQLDLKALSLNSNRFQVKLNAQDVMTSRKSVVSDKYSNESLNAATAKDANSAQIQLGENGGHGFGPAIERISSLKLSSASSPPMWSRADDKAGWFGNEYSRNGRMTGSEAVSSKGFSSVSVQNVHAMGRLPHVDGPSDGQRLSALSMLAAAGRTTNPEPTPRSIPSSESLYGPYGRGVSVMSDDVFRPFIPQEENM